MRPWYKTLDSHWLQEADLRAVVPPRLSKEAATVPGESKPFSVDEPALSAALQDPTSGVTEYWSNRVKPDFHDDDDAHYAQNIQTLKALNTAAPSKQGPTGTIQAGISKEPSVLPPTQQQEAPWYHNPYAIGGLAAGGALGAYGLHSLFNRPKRKEKEAATPVINPGEGKIGGNSHSTIKPTTFDPNYYGRPDVQKPFYTFDEYMSRRQKEYDADSDMSSHGRERRLWRDAHNVQDRIRSSSPPPRGYWPWSPTPVVATEKGNSGDVVPGEAKTGPATPTVEPPKPLASYQGPSLVKDEPLKSSVQWYHNPLLLGGAIAGGGLGAYGLHSMFNRPKRKEKEAAKNKDSDDNDPKSRFNPESPAHRRIIQEIVDNHPLVQQRMPFHRPAANWVFEKDTKKPTHSVWPWLLGGVAAGGLVGALRNVKSAGAFAQMPLQQVKPLSSGMPAASQPQKPNMFMQQNQQPSLPPNTRKPSVVAQLGRERGGAAAVQANIADMFNPQQQQGGPPMIQKRANLAAQLGLGAVQAYMQRKRKPMPPTTSTQPGLALDGEPKLASSASKTTASSLGKLAAMPYADEPALAKNDTYMGEGKGRWVDGKPVYEPAGANKAGAPTPGMFPSRAGMPIPIPAPRTTDAVEGVAKPGIYPPAELHHPPFSDERNIGKDTGKMLANYQRSAAKAGPPIPIPAPRVDAEEGLPKPGTYPSSAYQAPRLTPPLGSFEPSIVKGQGEQESPLALPTQQSSYPSWLLPALLGGGGLLGGAGLYHLMNRNKKRSEEEEDKYASSAPKVSLKMAVEIAGVGSLPSTIPTGNNIPSAQTKLPGANAGQGKPGNLIPEMSPWMKSQPQQQMPQRVQQMPQAYQAIWQRNNPSVQDTWRQQQANQLYMRDLQRRQNYTPNAATRLGSSDPAVVTGRNTGAENFGTRASTRPAANVADYLGGVSKQGPKEYGPNALHQPTLPEAEAKGEGYRPGPAGASAATGGGGQSGSGGNQSSMEGDLHKDQQHIPFKPDQGFLPQGPIIAPKGGQSELRSRSTLPGQQQKYKGFQVPAGYQPGNFKPDDYFKKGSAILTDIFTKKALVLPSGTRTKRVYG